MPGYAHHMCTRSSLAPCRPPLSFAKHSHTLQRLSLGLSRIWKTYTSKEGFGTSVGLSCCCLPFLGALGTSFNEALVLVPFVNRPFESEIHGTVNFTQFGCVLLVTWCYRVLLSCYLRRK